MDFDENLYDKIQAYLDKQLSREETQEFESAMAADEDLAREVQLHADMEELLADTPENNLRKNLERLGAESSDDTFGFDWRLLALIPIVFAIIGFLMFGSDEEVKITSSIQPPTKYEDSITNIKVKDTRTQTKIDTNLIDDTKDTRITEEVIKSEDKKSVEPPIEPKKKTKKKIKRRTTFGQPPPIIEIKSATENTNTLEDSTSIHEPIFMPTTSSTDTNTLANILTPIADGGISSDPSGDGGTSITRVLSSPSERFFPFRPDARLDSLAAIDYLVQEGFSLDITHLIPDTIRMPADSIATAYFNKKYLAELGLYFAADMETKDSINGERFVMITRESEYATWGYSDALAGTIGEDTYEIYTQPMFPNDIGVYYYEIYDEINERRIFAGKYMVVVENPKGYTSAETSIAFNTNRSLEKLVKKTNKTRRQFQIISDNLIRDFSLEYPDNKVGFEYKGKFYAKDDLAAKNLKIHLFSNKEEDFQNFSTLATHDFVVNNIGFDMFDFAYRKTYYLTPGLYYFLIQDEETGKIYYANKFEVRRTK